MLLLFLRAYSLGGGTYTGIEAVSNGLQIMREPRVQTGKRTMLYMATSLAFTAGGLFLCYLLLKVTPVDGQDPQRRAGRQPLRRLADAASCSPWSPSSPKGALLLVAAQAGFIDGPRVMANMAVDSWLPHRFAALSERLTMRNGIAPDGRRRHRRCCFTPADRSPALVVMYSINVFLTFSLSQFGMSTLLHPAPQKGSAHGNSTCRST